MKRTFRFAAKVATVPAVLDGETIELPVFPGILKHPRLEELPGLLCEPATARKYTVEALRVAAWPLLEQFPRAWLLHYLPDAPMRPQRRKALLFLLGAETQA